MTAKCPIKEAARNLGHKTYFNGKPCKNGHLCERRVSDGCCIECKRESVRISAKKYLHKRAEYARNWRSKNKDKVASSNKRKYAKNPTVSLMGYYRRQYKIRIATPKWVNISDIELIVKNRPKGFHVDHIIPICGILEDGNKVCGLHVPWNLQYLTKEQNLKKRNLLSGKDLDISEGRV